MIYTILIILLSIGADQFTKFLAVDRLKGNAPFMVIEDILRFRYLENSGAAFGMLADHRWVFMLLSTVLIVAILIFLFREKDLSPWFRVAAGLIVGGGVGNMIDRFAYGYVVDFIDVMCIDFYVFNVADSCVCVGCGMVLVGVIALDIKERKAQKAAIAAEAEVPGDGEAE